MAVQEIESGWKPAPETDDSKMAKISCTEDKIIEHEIEAIRSLKTKMPPNRSVVFRECTLDDAIKSICTAPFGERKGLFLYLHNSKQPFSQMFCENLSSGEMVPILNRSFLVLGWDIEEPEYHEALVSALNRHSSLSVVADLIANKVSIALCIVPINGNINLFLCLRGSISLKESIKSLKEVEKLFEEKIGKGKEPKKIKSKKSSEIDLGSEKLHSIWSDMLVNRDYDIFESDQHKYLKGKIGFALNWHPEKEIGYDNKNEEKIERLYKVIKTQSNKIEESKDKIEISFIYNCLKPLTEEKIGGAEKFDDSNPLADICAAPIFVLRKCWGSENPCRIFIDDNCRVYQSWRGYLTKNKYPRCEMVVPFNGRYQVENEKVLLEKYISPACNLDRKLLEVGDKVSAAVGLASGAVFIAAAISEPIAPALLMGAGIFGTVAGLWTIGRNILNLADREMHQEDMSFANLEARGAYLSIVAGSLGFVGAIANKAPATPCINRAKVVRGATYLVNTVGILNIGTIGFGIVNFGYEVFDQWYNKKQPPSALTILQLSSSVLFFGHAIYCFQGVPTISDETQPRISRNHKGSSRCERFRKLLKGIFNVLEDRLRSREEIISTIRHIYEVYILTWISRLFFNKKDKKEPENKGQVSKVNCPDCGGYYFGEA